MEVISTRYAVSTSTFHNGIKKTVTKNHNITTVAINGVITEIKHTTRGICGLLPTPKTPSR